MAINKLYNIADINKGKAINKLYNIADSKKGKAIDKLFNLTNYFYVTGSLV